MIKNVTLISPGEMGSPIAKYIISNGIKVISPLEGRSDKTRQRAKENGIIDSKNIKQSIKETDIIISILVPSDAKKLSDLIKKESSGLNKKIYFADLNAISPKTVNLMKKNLADTNINFIDGGIVGGPPEGNKFPRIYVSGPYSKKFMELNNMGMQVINMGGEIGEASAIKMAYASITKGYSSLLIAAVTLAIKTNNFDLLISELKYSQPRVYEDLKKLKGIPSKAHRWIGEMEEISNTYQDYDITGSFHKGSKEIYKRVSRSKLGEKRIQPKDINLDVKEFFENLY